MMQVRGAEDGHFIVKFTTDDFTRHWESIARELDTIEELWETWWTKEYLYSAVVAGQIQAWAVGEREANSFRVVLFTQVIAYPAGRALQGFLIFGNGLDEMLPVLDAFFEKRAAEIGCDFLEVSGRHGWARKLRRFGYSERTVTVTKLVGKNVEH